MWSSEDFGGVNSKKGRFTLKYCSIGTPKTINFPLSQMEN